MWRQIMTKPCGKCGADDRNKSGKCRPCQSAYDAAYRKANPEKLKIADAAYRKANTEKISISRAANYRAHPEKKKSQVLKYKYGITLEDYNFMYNQQDGCCKICHTHQSDLTISLCVDHCHETKKIRGLLCHACNIILGNAKDNPSILETAILYLRDELDDHINAPRLTSKTPTEDYYSPTLVLTQLVTQTS